MKETCRMWASHATRIGTHMNESCHTWRSHVTYEWVMSHMKETCRVWASHVTRMCDTTHLHVWHVHAARACVRLNNNEAHTHVTFPVDVWYNSFICDMTHSYLAGFFGLKNVDAARACVRLDDNESNEACIRVIFRSFSAKEPYNWLEQEWGTHLCDMTCAHVIWLLHTWHDSCTSGMKNNEKTLNTCAWIRMNMNGTRIRVTFRSFSAKEPYDDPFSFKIGQDRSISAIGQDRSTLNACLRGQYHLSANWTWTRVLWTIGGKKQDETCKQPTSVMPSVCIVSHFLCDMTLSVCAMTHFMCHVTPGLLLCLI